MDLKDILARAWGEVDDRKDVDCLDEYFAPGFVRHGRKDYSREDFKNLVRELYVGFPDLQRITLDMVQEGDQVAYRWETEGTHLGPFQGALATGRRIRAHGITISRFENGLIVEDWASWNELSLLHDLGILPIDR